MSESALRQAVELQARARVARDATVFASFCTPQALMQMRARAPMRAARFEVLAIVASGATGSSDVLYKGRAAHVLSQRWQQIEGVWTVVDVAQLPPPPRSIRERLAAMFGLGERTSTNDKERGIDEAA